MKQLSFTVLATFNKEKRENRELSEKRKYWLKTHLQENSGQHLSQKVPNFNYYEHPKICGISWKVQIEEHLNSKYSKYSFRRICQLCNHLLQSILKVAGQYLF